MKQNLAVELSEAGVIPDSLIRHGIRKLLRQRLDDINASDVESMNTSQSAFIEHMKSSAIALLPEKANEQHYEVPQTFYHSVLGPHAKYSCCYWDPTTRHLAQAEHNALLLTCEHADIEDGMHILELGCGWGSLTLWMANHYPNSTITAVSNSGSQGEHIRHCARMQGLDNINVITADMNDFQATGIIRSHRVGRNDRAYAQLPGTVRTHSQLAETRWQVFHAHFCAPQCALPVRR